MTLSPARPIRRAPMPALRHHAVRTGALSQQPAHGQPSTGRTHGLRAWLRAVLSALRTGTRARRLLLRRLLRRATIRRSAVAPAKRSATAGGNRRPRRLAASAGWFGFASR